jgi:hypothetical protein
MFLAQGMVRYTADSFFIKTQEVAMLPDSVEIKIKLKGLQDRLETLRGHL